MSDDATPQENKIIVDEDWKSQVEAEKEAATQEEQSAEAPKAESAVPLPPPSLTFLASSLYLQAMVGLGMLPNPVSDKPEVNLEQAKHVIDTLDMLFQKTEGNRTTEETQEMEQMLHQLRLGYVSAGQQGSPSSD
jgi:hypothetical protein